MYVKILKNNKIDNNKNKTYTYIKFKYTKSLKLIETYTNYIIYTHWIYSYNGSMLKLAYVQ